MEILAVIAVLAFIAVAVFFFLENGKLHARLVSLDEENRDLKSKKPAKAVAKTDEPKAKTETVTVADPELERDLDDARAEIKDLKKQIYDLKKGSKELKQEVKEAREDRTSEVLDSDLMFDLREEIADLHAENARLEEELKSARKAPRAEAPAPKREEPAPPPVVVAPSGNADVDALRTKYEKEISELRQEARELDRKLKSTASNVDKQRRRADNNDRAYKITQRQYDAAQERVELLEGQLKKAGFASGNEAIAASAAPAAKPAPQAAKPAPQAKPEPAAAKPAPPTPAPPTPAPPSTPQPAAQVVSKPKPKPEVGSTTVLSPMALASASKAEAPADEPEEQEETGTTQTSAKPVTSAGMGMLSKLREKAEQKKELSAAESGGHTAMLTPAALAASFPAAEEPAKPAVEASAPAPDESGAHTAVLSHASLSKAVSGEFASPDLEEGSNPRETAERTAILSPGAFAAPEEDTAEVRREDEPDGGRRPSSGLFGMPEGLLAMPPEEEQDPVRSTQFAFPTQIVDDNDAGGTAKFAPVTDADVKPSSRLGGMGATSTDNPADRPVPDANSADGDDANKNRLGGGRLGDLDLGDLGSAIDDAWGDLDVE